jgi:hypothetical protein
VAVGVAFGGDDRHAAFLVDAQETVRLDTDCKALIATVRPPSVPFLKPTAEDRPEAISR